MSTETGASELRLMTHYDVQAGMRLKDQAGWNQIEQDWKRFLLLEPAGCFVACQEGRVCGTVTSLRYQDRIGWIGMLLVDPAHRGQGIGTRLLRQSMDYLRDRQVEILKLDATPMGHPLYLQLGFVDEYPIERWEGVARQEPAAGLEIMTREELDRICRWDCEVFGADRSDLLKCLWSENPRYCAVVTSGSRIDGYIMGRAGSRAHYLGPWVAEPGSSAAERLFLEVQSRLMGEPIFVDILGENTGARELVQEAGFIRQRTLTRMYRGCNLHPGKPPMICSIAGPELG